MFRKFIASITIAAALLTCAGPQVWAQDASPAPITDQQLKAAPPAAAPTPVTIVHDADPVVTVNDGLLGGFLVLVFWVVKLLAPTLDAIGSTIGVKAKAEDILNDAKWRSAAKEISRTALNYALRAFKINPAQLENVGVRASVLRHANDWIVRQYGKKGDYLEWVDQDRNGQIDFLEGVLSDEGLLPPVDHTQPPQAAAPAVPAAA